MNAQHSSRRIPRILIVVTIAVTCAVLVGGHFYYQFRKEKLVTERQYELSAIADLKAEQIVSWRNERYGDSRAIQDNPLIIDHVQSFLRSPGSVRLKNDVATWFKLLKTTYLYQSVMLCDPAGTIIFSTETNDSVGIGMQCGISEAVRTKQIVFSDLHYNDSLLSIHMDIAVPLINNSDLQKKVLAVVLLRIDPNTYLYPLLKTWPIPSKTFETFIIRRNGDSVLYLSDLRHRSNSALHFQVPLSDEDIPASIAIRTGKSSIQGTDYRNISVISEARKIPNSSWYVMVKMDADELFAPLQREYRIIIFLSLLLIISFLSIVGFVWRSQRAEYYRTQYESELQRIRTEESLHESEEKFKYVFENSVIGKSITLPSGEINVNKAFCDILGYSREELAAKNWQDISYPDDIEMSQNIIASLVSGEKESARFVKRYIHKNGSIVWTDVGTSMRRDKSGTPMYFMTSMNDITERKHIEDVLYKNEQFLQETQRIARLGSYTLDISTGVWNSSPILDDIFGIEETYFHTVEGWTSIIHPEWRELMSNYFSNDVVGMHGQFDKEYKIVRTNDGEERWVHGLGRLEFDANNQPCKMIGTISDISERKQAELFIKESELRFRIASENLMDIIYEWDIKERIDWYGDIDKMMGYPTGDFPRTLTGWSELLHLDDKNGIAKAIENQLKENTPYNVEYRVRNMKNEWRWWSARGSALRDDHAQPYKWIGSITDITEQKLADETIKNSEKKYRTLHESMIDGFVSVAMDGKFIECNEVYRSMLGYSETELAQLSYVDITPERWHTYETGIVENQILKRGYSDIYQKEYRRKDGTIFPVELHTVLMRDERGNPVSMWAIVRDISERKRVEQEIIRLNEDLEERVIQRTAQLESTNKELESFSYSVSHDLRAPLRSIDGFSQALLEDYSGKLDEQGKNYLIRVRSNTQKMAILIDDMLNLARVTRAVMKLEPVNLSVMAASIFEELQEQDTQRSATITIMPDLIDTADPALTKAVLQNLLDNAWKFTSKKPLTVIEFGVTDREGVRTYFVRDNGAGFNMKYVNKLFTPFQRLHQSNEFFGTGIGLATVQRIIHRHGGKVQAEGTIDNGATFYFTLHS